MSFYDISTDTVRYSPTWPTLPAGIVPRLARFNAPRFGVSLPIRQLAEVGHIVAVGDYSYKAVDDLTVSLDTGQVTARIDAGSVILVSPYSVGLDWVLCAIDWQQARGDLHE